MRAYKAAILSAEADFTPQILPRHRRRLPKHSPIPTWDFGLMLRPFALAPLEPLDSASLEVVTYKTFVLTALALSARRGGLCALRRGQFIRSTEDWSVVLLYSDPSFIPIMAKGRLCTEPYNLSALPPGALPRVDATVLCPVRALKAYMEKTADSSFVNNRETLFLPLSRTRSLTLLYFKVCC